MAVNTTLLQAARLGEPVALVALLTESRVELRRYAQKNCMVSDIDDAVQESLIIVSRSVASVQHLRAWSSWLFQIVRRECHRLGRVTLRTDLWDEDAVNALMARKTENDLTLDVAAALESLPEHYREVVVLRDFEGLTIGEMASALKTTSLAVKARLHRARELTREYLLRE